MIGGVRLSTLVLTSTLAAGIVSIALSARESLTNDDRPAMVLWDIKVVSEKLRAGEPFSYSFNYSKRAECSPPKGSGEVSYRIWSKDADGAFTTFQLAVSTVSYAAPAINGFRTTSIEMPKLRPGEYAVQYRTRFECAGARQPQLFDGPLMQFEVVP